MPLLICLPLIVQGSRKIIYKGLVKDCLSVICDVFSDLSDQSESTSDLDSVAPPSKEISYINTSAFALALPELKRSTCFYLKKLLIMVNSCAFYSLKYVFDQF